MINCFKIMYLWQRIKFAVNTLSSYFGVGRRLNKIVEEKQRDSEDTKAGYLIITKKINLAK